MKHKAGKQWTMLVANERGQSSFFVAGRLFLLILVALFIGFVSVVNLYAVNGTGIYNGSATDLFNSGGAEIKHPEVLAEIVQKIETEPGLSGLKIILFSPEKQGGVNLSQKRGEALKKALINKLRRSLPITLQCHAGIDMQDMFDSIKGRQSKKQALSEMTKALSKSLPKNVVSQLGKLSQPGQATDTKSVKNMPPSNDMANFMQIDGLYVKDWSKNKTELSKLEQIIVETKDPWQKKMLKRYKKIWEPGLSGGFANFPGFHNPNPPCSSPCATPGYKLCSITYEVNYAEWAYKESIQETTPNIKQGVEIIEELKKLAAEIEKHYPKEPAPRYNPELGRNVLTKQYLENAYRKQAAKETKICKQAQNNNPKRSYDELGRYRSMALAGSGHYLVYAIREYFGKKLIALDLYILRHLGVKEMRGMSYLWWFRIDQPIGPARRECTRADFYSWGNVVVDDQYEIPFMVIDETACDSWSPAEISRFYNKTKLMWERSGLPPQKFNAEQLSK